MSPQTIPLNDAAVAMLGMCDNDCGRPAVSGFGRGLYKHCSRACERANVVTFDRETVLQLRQESDAAMTVAAKKSNPDEVAAIEAAEAAARDRVRTKIGKKSTLAPVVTPTQKPAPAPIAAPIQVADVVAVVPEPKPVREPVVAPIRYPGLPPQCQPRPFVLRPAEEMRPGLCRRAECKRPPVHRDLCDPCYTVACGRKILEEVAGPCRPNIGSRSRDPANSLLSMLERAVIEKPGVHITELVEPLGRPPVVIWKAVCNRR